MVALLLLLLKPQLGSLAKRLNELTLPGGTKASFANELNLAQSEAIHLAAKASGNSELTGSIPEGPAIPAKLPFDRISASFQNVLDFMARQLTDIPLEERKSPSDFVFYELKPRPGGREIYDLFERLRNIYVSTAQLKAENISEADAKQYEDLCLVFKGSFIPAANDWKHAKGLKAS